jgi:predicted short-subunit dehydrogenase-like oxidoreductase (DUF2520 family)
LQPIGIAGAGRVGQALGRLLRAAAIASRTPAHAAEGAAFVGGSAIGVSYAELPRHASRILMAVPDDAIAEVARTLDMHAGAVLHTSGAHGPEALEALAAAGVSCGTLHPLQTVASPAEGVAALPGAAFAIDGEGEALAWAAEIVAQLGGIALRIPARARPLYHAAAVMAGNYVIAVLAAAVMLIKEAGVEEAVALRALEPLARTSLENALRLGPAAALTGPIQRGDLETLRSHIAALAGAPAAITNLYRAAGLEALELARARGLPAAVAHAIDDILRKGGGYA